MTSGYSGGIRFVPFAFPVSAPALSSLQETPDSPQEPALILGQDQGLSRHPSPSSLPSSSHACAAASVAGSSSGHTHSARGSKQNLQVRLTDLPAVRGPRAS